MDAWVGGRMTTDRRKKGRRGGEGWGEEKRSRRPERRQISMRPLSFECRLFEKKYKVI